MKPYLRAEWTKLRTLPGTGWLLLTFVALTVAGSAAASAVVSCAPDGCDHDPARISLFGVQAGQAVVAVLAVLTISGEYGTGMIRVTLAALPGRIAVLAAKAVVLSGLTLAVGSVAVFAAAVAGQRILAGNGFGAEATALTSGPMLRATAGSVLASVNR